jgi:acylphosphatase
MKARAHIWVAGRVQGVFFRDHTRRWAVSLNLTGWVKNLRDGRVEVLAEGEKKDIDQLIKKLERGPDLAQVDRVDTEWNSFKGEFNDFQISYSGFWSL